MRVLDGDQSLVRIFIGECDTWHGSPLPRALLERLRAEGFAGATVIRGVAGFGANSVIHTASLVDLSPICLFVSKSWTTRRTSIGSCRSSTR